jgi:hypothetical protein
MRGKLCGGAETRRDAANEGMDVDMRLAALEGIGIGVALGDLAGVALDGALDLELNAELVVDTEFERVVDRENRVDVSDGALDDVRGGISITFFVLVLDQWPTPKRVDFLHSGSEETLHLLIRNSLSENVAIVGIIT